ncbi:MAG TPA: MarR family transcriptional regulator [Verrucomicrobiales bacterium]|nr:MarR family transcriptional regulator [Verrucomicrobiales bacterium]HIL70975.1 MarR family transcriptional regulator [Verrucomicrobiota bacterium]
MTNSDPAKKRLPVLLRRAWYGMNQAFRRRIAKSGLTPDQFTLLRTLEESGKEGLTQKDLSDRMSSDPNTIASLVDRMQRNGLILRQPHESDGRAHRIRLGDAGRERFDLAKGEAIELQHWILDHLAEEDRDSFLTNLKTIADACREAVEQSPGKKKKL